MDINTKFGLMFMAKSIVEERKLDKGMTTICSMCNKETGFVGEEWIMAVYINEVCYCGECSLNKMGSSSIGMNGKFVKKKKKKFVVKNIDWVWCCGNKIPKDMEGVGCSYCF